LPSLSLCHTDCTLAKFSMPFFPAPESSLRSLLPLFFPEAFLLSLFSARDGSELAAPPGRNREESQLGMEGEHNPTMVKKRLHGLPCCRVGCFSSSDVSMLEEKRAQPLCRGFECIERSREGGPARHSR